MSLRTKPLGRLADNSEVTLFILGNDTGATASVMNYGATLVALETPDRHGHVADIILGFDTLDGYVTRNSPHFGGIVGRCANRIALGRFRLDGKEYRLATNDGAHHLHGGHRGFDASYWQAEPDTAKPPSVKFIYSSPDGEEGYPGNLAVTVVYTLTDDHELKIEYTATTDQATPVNLTNHAYFNLAGAGNVHGHELMIASTHYIPVDHTLIPTGKIDPIKGTPLDFTARTPIGQRVDELTGEPGGYDHTFVLDSDGETVKLAARVHEPRSGRMLEVHTTEPGVQFYSGNFLDGTISGKGGRVYHKHAGLCLETQHFPDSINQPTFPSVVLRPGEIYRQKTTYRLGVM
jgi:aldose 1-epimerase